MKKNSCSTVEEYLSFFEENAFIEKECKNMEEKIVNLL